MRKEVEEELKTMAENLSDEEKDRANKIENEFSNPIGELID